MLRADLRKSEIKLVGISVRTNNKLELEPDKSRIGSCVQRYFHESVFDKIPYRVRPGVTFCAYTDYENDYRGDHTYFIGEEVFSLEDKMSEVLKALIIPEQQYSKFTAGPGPMPKVIKDAWTEIWNMSPKVLGGKRCYTTDFEVYDERASDPQKVVLDLYIGVTPV